jgi:hypothetical protein
LKLNSQKNAGAQMIAGKKDITDATGNEKKISGSLKDVMNAALMLAVAVEMKTTSHQQHVKAEKNLKNTKNARRVEVILVAKNSVRHAKKSVQRKLSGQPEKETALSATKNLKRVH